MSTDYPLTPRLWLGEASNTVTLYDEDRELTGPMDARELVRIGLYFMKVASYIDGDLSQCIEGQDDYALGELRSALGGAVNGVAVNVGPR